MKTQRSQHHYVLAHYALRKICEGDPMMFFALMGSPKRDEFLKDVWAQVCENCAQSGKPDFNIGHVGVETTRIKKYPAILFVFPAPQKMAEAYFAAVVLTVDLDNPAPDEAPSFRYFTLEYSLNMYNNQPYTVVAEWCGDAHANMGKGPNAEAGAFLEWVESRV